MSRLATSFSYFRAISTIRRAFKIIEWGLKAHRVQKKNDCIKFGIIDDFCSHNSKLILLDNPTYLSITNINIIRITEISLRTTDLLTKYSGIKALRLAIAAIAPATLGYNTEKGHMKEVKTINSYRKLLAKSKDNVSEIDSKLILKIAFSDHKISAAYHYTPDFIYKLSLDTMFNFSPFSIDKAFLTLMGITASTNAIRLIGHNYESLRLKAIELLKVLAENDNLTEVFTEEIECKSFKYLDATLYDFLADPDNVQCKVISDGNEEYTPHAHDETESACMLGNSFISSNQ